MWMKIDVEANMPYDRVLPLETFLVNGLVNTHIVASFRIAPAEVSRQDPDTVNVSIAFRAANPKAVDDILDALSEFGTPERKMAKEVMDLLSRIASEANTEAGMPSSPTDVMLALKAATGHGHSTWHDCVRQKLSEFFD